MGKIIDLSEVRMQSLRKELDAYQEAIRSAEEALAEATEKYGDEDPEFVSEEEVARENGCTIDDDGHWIPIEDDEDDWW